MGHKKPSLLLHWEFLIIFYQTGPCNVGAKKVKADDEEGQSAEHEEEQHGEAEKDAHRLLDGEEHLGGQGISLLIIIIIITITIIHMLDGQEQVWWWQEAGNTVPALRTRLNNFSVSCTSLLERINNPVSSAFKNLSSISAHQFDWILKALGPVLLPYLVYNEDVVDPWGRLPFSCVNQIRSLLSHWQLNI